MAYKRTTESIAKYNEFLHTIARTGVDPTMINEAIALTLEAVCVDEDALSEARWLEKVRALQSLVQVQRLLEDKPTTIIGRKDLTEMSDTELEGRITTLQKELLERQGIATPTPLLH